MKKIYLLVAGLVTVGYSSMAQSGSSPNYEEAPSKIKVSNINYSKPSPVSKATKSASCTPDTIDYGYYKQEILGTSGAYYSDKLVGPNRTGSQGFDLSTDIKIHGATFYASANTGNSFDVRVYLYSVDSAYKPVSAIDSADVTVSSFGVYQAIFNQPVSHNSKFSIGVRNFSTDNTDTLKLIVNDGETTTFGEGLAWRRYGSGSWNAGTTYFGGASPGWNPDYLISPIISYDINTDFTVSADTANCSDTIILTNTTSLDIKDNHMLTMSGFVQYWLSQPDSTFEWNLNGTVSLDTNGTHTIVVDKVNNTVTLSSIILGYYTNCSDEATKTITGKLDLSTSKTDYSLCTSINGAATVTANSGSGSYTYLWDDASAQTNDTATNLVGGAYTVTVTDASTSGCYSTADVTVDDLRTFPSVSVSSNATTICGGSDGDATATVTGNSTYSYLWDDASSQTTATATGLTLGSYSVVVTDNANGCETSKTATVTDGGAPSITLTADSVTCNGLADGSATITSASDISAYIFTWSDNQTGLTASNLLAGNYTVSGTDGVCTINGNITIGEPTALTAIATATDISCNGLTDGSVSVSANGGTANYTYSWTPGNATSATVNNLGANTYSVTVTDANGCTATANATVIEPAILTASASSTNITCNGDADGSLTGSANGGTAPFTYSWTGGANTANASNVDAGTYTLTITDNSGCTASSSAVTVAEPTALGLTGTATDATFGMSDGSVSVTATGGTNPYAYSWAPSGGNAATASNLAANDYTVTVTDANGCTKTGTYTVANAGNPPCAIAVVVDTMTSASNGGNNGAITVAVSGNYGAITYSWTPAAPNSPTITALTAGDYTVIVADTMGCKDTLTVNVPNVTGIANQAISKVNIYPTPVADNLNITFNAGENNASVKVLSLTGQVVYSENIRTSNGVFKTSIDMSNQASGVYFLQIISGGNNITKKVIKN